MQKLSVCEFKSRMTQVPPNRIIFDSANQEWSTPYDSMKIKLVFDTIKVGLNPNTVVIKSSANTMQFRGVRCVKIDESLSWCNIYHFVCDDLATGRTKKYTIIVE